MLAYVLFLVSIVSPNYGPLPRDVTACSDATLLNGVTVRTCEGRMVALFEGGKLVRAYHDDGTIEVILGGRWTTLGAPTLPQDECDGSHDQSEPDPITDALRRKLGASDDGQKVIVL